MLKRFLQRDEGHGPGGRAAPRVAPRPVVSIVVVVFRMADQAARTVRSLLTDYQEDASASDYEVIIVENESSELMSPAFIDSLPDNFRYFLRKNPESSPAAAINFGAGQSRGDHICIMIDGARMLTPGVVRNLVLGHRLDSRSVVAVPGYHLGAELQQEAVNSGYNTHEEQRLLESVHWPLDGYRLFEVSCFSGSCAPGFFLPNSESNCVSVSRELWQELGGFDERFDYRGGGLINLDYYKRACEMPGVLHVIAIGEGTFHQFHGGVTTGGQAAEMREAYIDASKEQYLKLRGQEFESPQTSPVFLGEIPSQALRFIEQSIDRSRRQTVQATPIPARAADG